MDNWDKRVQGTVFVWIAFAVAVGMTNISGQIDSNNVVITLIAAIAAFVTTAAIWSFASDQAHGGDALRDAEKAKRSEPTTAGDLRLALLLQLMDEDERRALKRRIVDDLSADGEAISLADLLAAEEGDARRGQPNRS
jgi:hypothetical protein